MTTGISAPPIGNTRNTPSTLASKTTAQNGHAKDPLGSALALEQRGDFVGGTGGLLHQPFVARAILDFATGFGFAFAGKHGRILCQVGP